jgi:hypothetical protein
MFIIKNYTTGLYKGVLPLKCDQNEISRTNINKSIGITNLHRKVCKLRPSIVYVF